MRLWRAGVGAALALSICGCEPKRSSEVDVPGELGATFGLSDDSQTPGVKHYVSAQFATQGPVDEVMFDQGERITANGIPLERAEWGYTAAVDGPEPASYVFELDAGDKGVFSHDITFSARFSVLSPAAGDVLSPDEDIVVQVDEAVPEGVFKSFLDFPSMGTEVVLVGSVDGVVSESDPTQILFPAALVAEKYDFVAESSGAAVNAELRIFRDSTVTLEDPSPYLDIRVYTSRWVPRVPITLQR